MSKSAASVRDAVAFVYGTDIIAVDGACMARFDFNRAMIVNKAAVPPDTPVRDFRSSSGATVTTFGQLGGLSLMVAGQDMGECLTGVGLPGAEVAAAIVAAYRAEVAAIVASDLFYASVAPWKVRVLGEQIYRRLLGRGRGLNSFMWYEEAEASRDDSDSDDDDADDDADEDTYSKEAAEAAARKMREPPPSEVDLLAGERIAAIVAAPARRPQELTSRRPIRVDTTLPEGLDAENDCAFSFLSDRDRARVVAAGAITQGGVRAAFAEFVASRPGLIRDFIEDGHACAVDRAAVAREISSFTSKIRRRSWELMSASAPHPDSFDAAVLEIIRRRVALSPAAFAARDTPASPIVEASIRGGAGALNPSPEIAICNAVYSGDAGEAEVAAAYLPLCMREVAIGGDHLAALCEFTGGVLPLLDLSRTSLTGSAVAMLSEERSMPPALVRLRACAYAARPLGPAPGEWLVYDEIVKEHCDMVSDLIYEITADPPHRRFNSKHARLIRRANELYRRIVELRGDGSVPEPVLMSEILAELGLESEPEPGSGSESGSEPEPEADPEDAPESVGTSEGESGSESEGESGSESEGESGSESEGESENLDQGWTEGFDQGWREAEGVGQGWHSGHRPPRRADPRPPRREERPPRPAERAARAETGAEDSVEALTARLNAIVTSLLDDCLRIEGGALVLSRAEDAESAGLGGAERAERERDRAELAEREGADVDLAVAADDDDEFDRIAAAHVEAVRRKYPGAPARRAEQGGGRHKWVVETPVRNFEIYRAPLDRVVTHHVAPARAAYTAQPLPGEPAPPGPRLLVSTSFANVCDPAPRASSGRKAGYLREIRSWASRRTSPLEILAKYEARGFKTNSAWARLIAAAAFAPDARHLHAHAACVAISSRWGAMMEQAARVAIMCDAFAAPVRGADEWLPGALKFED